MLPRLHRYGPDLALLLFCVPFAVEGFASLPVGDHPWAGYLFGADAGEWALNAQMIRGGDTHLLDQHRGPPFPIAIALARSFATDLAHAGHLVTALAWSLRPFVLYALGRICGGRLVGIFAALLSVSLLPLYYSAAKYGVDAFLTTMLPLALASVGPARRFPMWAWVAGVVVGVAMLTHLTAVAWAAPALLLLWWRGDASERPISAWARPLLFGSGLLALLLLAHTTFGLIGKTALLQSVSEGVSKGASDPTGSSLLSQKAMDTLLAGRHSAPVVATQALLLPFLDELDQWGLFLGLVWAGIVGVSLRSEPSARAPAAKTIPGRRRGAHARPWLRIPALPQKLRILQSDAGTGAIPLTTLAPAPFFAAAVAPDRYTENLLPFVALLVARGMASVVHTAGRLVPSTASPYVVGIAAVLGLGLVSEQAWSRLETATRFLSPPSADAASTRALARKLRRGVESDSAVASPIREVPAYLDRAHCPRSSCVPGAGEPAFERCAQHLRESCGGTGPIPLVWVEVGPVGMGDDDFSRAFGAWAADRWGVAGTYKDRTVHATFIAVPRID